MAVSVGSSAGLEHFKQQLANRGINLVERTKKERWLDVVQFVKSRFPKAEPITRRSFPFDLEEYETLISWSQHCRNCTRPERCRHYGYQAQIRFRKNWSGRYYPDGVFIPEYYGGKCEAYINALRRQRQADEEYLSDKPNSSSAFHC